MMITCHLVPDVLCCSGASPVFEVHGFVGTFVDIIVGSKLALWCKEIKLCEAGSQHIGHIVDRNLIVRPGKC